VGYRHGNIGRNSQAVRRGR